MSGRGDGSEAEAPSGDGPGPLADLRVIDLATVIAGPGCARYLADFGADVIKVERPPGGDGVRAMGWTDPTDGLSLWWKIVGRNKRTIALDLKDPDDLAAVRRLIDSADVLVENFRPGTLERLGLDPDVLHRTNPRLVVTRVTGFGQTGPYKDRPGFATQAEALSGFAAINGEPDGQPLLPPIRPSRANRAPLLPAVASQLGLAPGTPVVAGPFSKPMRAVPRAVRKETRASVVVSPQAASSTTTFRAARQFFSRKRRKRGQGSRAR